MTAVASELARLADVASELALLAHVASTFWMIGLVWFVQAVHYPLFARVGSSAFAAYEADHCVRTNLVVGPPMLVEMASALWLMAAPPADVPREAAAIGLGLLAVVWLSTLGLQVPRHAELSRGFDARAHRALVRTNWIPTLAWSARGVLVLWIVARAIEGRAIDGP